MASSCSSGAWGTVGFVHDPTPERGAFCNRPCVFCIHKKVVGLRRGPAELTNNLVSFAGTFLWIQKIWGPTKEAHAGEWVGGVPSIFFQNFITSSNH